MSDLKILSADCFQALQVPAREMVDGVGRLGKLPIWMDDNGDVRIAIRKDDPQHAADFHQIVVEPGDLLRGVGELLMLRGPTTRNQP